MQRYVCVCVLQFPDFKKMMDWGGTSFGDRWDRTPAFSTSAGWPWEGFLTSLSLKLLSYKMNECQRNGVYGTELLASTVKGLFLLLLRNPPWAHAGCPSARIILAPFPLKLYHSHSSLSEYSWYLFFAHFKCRSPPFLVSVHNYVKHPNYRNVKCRT